MLDLFTIYLSGKIESPNHNSSSVTSLEMNVFLIKGSKTHICLEMFIVVGKHALQLLWLKLSL